ncbi:MAG: TIGR02206 family membrane protein [Planctomycetota bacterium]
MHGVLALADTLRFPWGHARWTVLGLVIVTSGVLALLLRHSAARGYAPALRRVVCWGLAAVLTAGVATAELQRVAAGVWTVEESLPLHLCDLAVLITVAALWGVGRAGRSELRGGKAESDRAGRETRWPQRLFEIAFVWGIGGTTQAVLTPDMDDTVLDSACVRYFILHGGILVGVLVLTFGVRLRLEPGAPQRVWLTTLAVATAVFPLNWLLGANYLYLMGPPRYPSLIEWLGPWPWYLAPLTGVATLLILLCYAPFWLADRRRRRDERAGSSRRTDASLL